MDSPLPQPALSPVDQFLGEISRRYAKQAGLLLALSFLASAFSFIQALIGVAFDEGLSLTLNLIFFIPGLVLALFGSLGLYAALALPTEATNVRQALLVGSRYFWKNLTTTLLYSVIVIGAALLFILPGIYFGLLFSLGGYLVMKENLANRRALNRSRELIRGRWWAVFVRYLVLGLLLVAAAFLVGLFFGLIFLATPESTQSFMQDILSALVQWLSMPVSALALAVLYDQLRATPAPTA